MLALTQLPEDLLVVVLRSMLQGHERSAQADSQDVGRLEAACTLFKALARGHAEVIAVRAAARQMLTERLLHELQVATGTVAADAHASRPASYLDYVATPPTPTPTIILGVDTPWRLDTGLARTWALVRVMYVSTDLVSVELDGEGAAFDINVLADAVVASPALKALTLKSCDIDRVSVAAVAAAVASSGSLEDISLPFNSICARGAQLLSQSLLLSRSLDEVALQYNNLGDAGATAVAVLVAASPTLRLLRLRDNHIGAIGAAALAEGVAASRSLVLLSVGENVLGDAGATSMAGGVANSTSLMGLVLDSNGIGDVGAIELAHAVVSGGGLDTLILEHNDIGDDGALALAEAVASPTFHRLMLRGCSYGASSADALRAAAAAKPHFGHDFQAVDLDEEEPDY